MRAPAVAGLFYPERPAPLAALVDRLLAGARGLGTPHLAPVRALLVPHAGLAYSGAIAARAWRALAADRRPATLVLVGPDHRGACALGASGEDWRTPLGRLRTDADVHRALLDAGIPDDPRGHAREHSLEVQLPFVQRLWPDDPPGIVCVAMGRQDAAHATRLADALRAATAGRDVVLVASCDLSHEGANYGRAWPDADAVARGDMARFLDGVAKLDPRGLLNLVETEDISSCGHGPVAAVLGAAGATRAHVLASGTSGDVAPGDSSVAYAAVAFT